MTLLLIGIVVWILVLVFACSLGAAARIGDRRERERLAAATPPAGSDDPDERGPLEPPPVTVVTVRGREDELRRELALTKRALLRAQTRLAELEDVRARGAA